jgi:hypothetical protein
VLNLSRGEVYMKKAIFSILLSITVISLIFGFKEGDTAAYKIKLELDKEVMDYLASTESPIINGNDNKFGKTSPSSTRLHMDFKVAETLYDSNKVKIVKVNVKGQLINAQDSFPFEGNDEIYLVRINQDREIFVGNVKIDIKNAKEQELGVISIRYEPKTQQADVSLTSGPMSNSGMIAFGKLFITHEEQEMINSVLGKIGE